MSEANQIENLLKQLKKSRKCAFPAAGFPNATIEKGVYVIVDANGCVLHIGQTPRGQLGIRQRLRNHLQGSSSFVQTHFNGDGSRLRDGCAFRYLIVDDPRRPALLESLAIGKLCPVHLGIHQRIE